MELSSFYVELWLNQRGEQAGDVANELADASSVFEGVGVAKLDLSKTDDLLTSGKTLEMET